MKTFEEFMAEQFWANCFVDDLPNFEKVWDAAITNKVPDGFVVVPVEPTKEMIKAFHDRYWLPHQLTDNELSNELCRLQNELQRRIRGNPMGSVYAFAAQPDNGKSIEVKKCADN